VEEALKDGNQALVADLDAAEVLQPGVGAFDFPGFAVSSQLAFVFEAAMTVVAAVGSDQLAAALFPFSAQRIGVISAVCNHASQTGTRASRATARHLHRTKRAFCKQVFGNLRSRRQQVDPSEYCSGKSRHRAPVRRTQRMLSRQARFEAQGRPRPSRRRFGSGNNGANIIHCSTLNNTSRFFREEAQQPLLLMRKSLA
jgi:hypothetical protein